MTRAMARSRPGVSGAAAALALAALLGLAGCASPHPTPGAPAQATAAAARPAALAAVPAGSRVRNPESGRLEAVVPEIAGTALLIGDSQSEPADGWPRQGLAAAGYKVYFCGRGGTGFVTANGATGNYLDALREEDWLLPSGTPALIVIQGGGNDAASGASNSRIAGNANELISELQARYPGTRIAMVGTLARGAGDGGGRRTEVDVLLGSVAAAHNLPFVSVGDWLTRYGLAKDLEDAVHMNPAGRQALGALLEERLRHLGLDRKPVPDSPPVLASGSGGGGED